MARKPRIHFTGAVYHVMLRGNDGQDIFFHPKDYVFFEELVAEGVSRFQHRIHGYCWMTNHIHMVVEVANVPLSKIIQNISFRYSRWINKRENRTGHLFQGRYKAILIDTDNYLLELVRYIHLNPVRSKLVKSPADYPWSGHQAYLGITKHDWIFTDWVLQRFDSTKMQARNAYQRFVSNGMDEAHRKEFHEGNVCGVALGDERFIENIPGHSKANTIQIRPLMELSDISKQVCFFFQIPEEQLNAKGRSAFASRVRSIIALIFTEQFGRISQAAEYFDRDLSTMSRQVTNLKRKLISDNSLKQEIKSLKKFLNATTQA